MIINQNFLRSSQRTVPQLVLLGTALVSLYYANDVCVSRWWLENDGEGPVAGEVVRHEGLWFKCATDPGGTSCEGLELFWVDLATPLIAARGLAWLSIGLLCIVIAMYWVGCNMNNLLTKKAISDMKFRYRARAIKIRIFNIGMVLHVIAACAFWALSMMMTVGIVDAYFYIKDSTGVAGHSKQGHSFIWSQAIYDSWLNDFIMLVSVITCYFVNSNKKQEWANDFENAYFNDEKDVKYDVDGVQYV